MCGCKKHQKWIIKFEHILISLRRLKPSGPYMYRQFNSQQFFFLHTHCICLFCVDLRTNAITSLYNINWLVCITEI